MKKTTALIGALLLSTSLIGSAFASDAHYGQSTAKKAAVNGANYSQVVLHNYTHDTYMAYATFQPSGKQTNLHVGEFNSGTDVITYDVDYPDSTVCFNVIRDFDGAQVFNSCVNSGNVNIGPYLSANKKPNVQVTK
jgi:hypothetical protein